MAENQEEKITLAVRKAGFKVDDILEKLSISKQTWYNRIRKAPLDPIFKENLEAIGVKLDEKSNEGQDEYSKEYLIKETIRLHERLEEVMDKSFRDKDKIIELQVRIDQLKDQLGRNQA
jgi:hypothetical protein